MKYTTALLLLTVLLLAGCGQKGPLYLPGDEAAAQQTTTTNGAQSDQTPVSGAASPHNAFYSTGAPVCPNHRVALLCHGTP